MTYFRFAYTLCISICLGFSAFGQKQAPELRLSFLTASGDVRLTEGVLVAEAMPDMLATKGVVLDARFDLGNGVFIQPELGYTQREIKHLSGSGLNLNGAFLGEHSSERFGADQVDLGWQLGFGKAIVEKWNVYASGGIRVQLSAQNYIRDSEPAQTDQLVDDFIISGVVIDHSWTGRIGIGTAYQLSEQWGLFVDAAYFSDLSDFAKETFGSLSMRRSGLSLQAGVAFSM